MKQAAPVILKTAHYAGLDKAIAEVFWRTIYEPIIKALELKAKEIKNERETPLIAALRTDRVYFQDGAFYGDFTSAISRELKSYGARFNRLKRAWVGADFPMIVTSAIAEQNVRQTQQLGKLVQVLDALDDDSIYPQFDLFEPIEKAMDGMEAAFDETLKSISIPVKLTPEAKKVIAEEWAKNADLYIKDFRKQEIIKLRSQIQANTFMGGRSTAMIKTIQDSYGVSRNKAKFLARQETSLLLSKMREQRYKDIGAKRYRWSGVNDGRERPDHVALNGKVFSWDDPPVTNKETGARNHPGEDFGCRCVAVPIIDGE